MATTVQLTPAQEAKRQRILALKTEYVTFPQRKKESLFGQFVGEAIDQLIAELANESGYDVALDPAFERIGK
jgi:hypothetical protein